MKVLFYIPTLKSGGAEKQCAMIASGLKSLRGHDVSVILDFGDGIKDSNKAAWDSAGVDIIVLPRGRIRAILGLRKILAANRDSCLFTYLTRCNLVGSLVARMVGLKNVYAGVRSGSFPWWKYVIELLVNRVLAVATIFNSCKAYAKFTRLGFSDKKCLVIGNAVVLTSTSPERRIDGKVIVSTIGRFVPVKDYYTWLKVILETSRFYQGIEAHIVGWGALELDIRRWIGILNLSDIVHLYPLGTDVAKLLNESDIYLSTSLSEGVSNAILEAMEAGLPVVATNVGDNEYLVEDGRSGFLADVCSISALSDGVLKLANSSSLRAKFGARAREIVKERHSLNLVLDKYCQLIDRK